MQAKAMNAVLDFWLTTQSKICIFRIISIKIKLILQVTKKNLENLRL